MTAKVCGKWLEENLWSQQFQRISRVTTTDSFYGCPEKRIVVLGKRSKILICFKYFAASLWSVMTLGMANKSEKKEEEYQETLLANQSLLFLLVLTNHCTTEFSLNNPYRQALCSFTNSQGQFVCRLEKCWCEYYAGELKETDLFQFS